MPSLYHPLVVHFPVALWMTSALFDLLYARSTDRFHFRASQFLIGLGLLGAAVSVVTGYADYLPLVREGIGAEFVARHKTHQVVALAATVVYAVSFYARWRQPHLHRTTLLLLTAVGALLIGATGLIGGDLRMVM
ncbi:MAG: DUF2231 domain-containing protein [Armatimonadota bacterium]|nr:DUF2231 domain-containing protein [Armatimonadota bacterium]